MIDTDNLRRFLESEGIEYRLNAAVAPYTTMGIGGTCPVVIIARSRGQLADCVRFLAGAASPYILVGGGSNIIFPDKACRFALLVNRSSEIRQRGFDTVEVDSGTPVESLMEWSISNGCAGLEFLAGIPGSLGGALAVNAGAFRRCMADILMRADLMENGETRSVGLEYFHFDYRSSRCKAGDSVILGMQLRCERDSPRRIARRINGHLKYRRRNHPRRASASAGCMFTNPRSGDRRISAGRLIEESGLKGRNTAHLEVSGRHANFIINRGGAEFEELDRLIREIRDAVEQRHGIRLHREVIYVSEDGKKY